METTRGLGGEPGGSIGLGVALVEDPDRSSGVGVALGEDSGRSMGISLHGKNSTSAPTAFAVAAGRTWGLLWPRYSLRGRVRTRHNHLGKTKQRL